MGQSIKRKRKRNVRLGKPKNQSLTSSKPRPVKVTKLTEEEMKERWG